jgi:hypothetical protein
MSQVTKHPLLHAGGLSFAYNTQLYLEEYYSDIDDDNRGLWIALCSIIGGSFGVFFGGFFSDVAVKKMGMHSRLWLLSFFTVQ